MRIVKWYLDLVTDDGAALIVYVASIAWNRVHVDFASTLLALRDAEPVERTVWTGVCMPEANGAELRFAQRDLGVVAEWRGESPPLQATLLDDAGGRVDWSCGWPSAAVRAEVTGRTLVGRGYAECLTMTCAPWRLPLRRLRWGRYASASHAAVWIDWSGGPPRRWVWLDGVPRRDAALDAESVVDLGDGTAIHVQPVRELCDRRSLKVLSSRLPALAPLFSGPIGDLRDAKRLARGRLCRDGEGVDEGWIVDEVVSW